MKRKISLLIVLIAILIWGIGCNSKDLTPDNYQNYNDTIENYFLAYAEEDLYTMKQYLPLNIIQENKKIGNAKESDETRKPERKEKMGDRYSIKGFDYFYEDYGEIYYSIEFFNYKTNDNKSLVFGVREENDKLIVFGAYGNSGIGGKHVKEVTNGEYFTTTNIKEVMKKYPDNTFVVKEYSEP